MRSGRIALQSESHPVEFRDIETRRIRRAAGSRHAVLMDATNDVAAPFMSGPELLQAFERVKRVDGWEETIRAFIERYDMEPGQAIAWTRFLTLNWGRIEADYLTIGPSGHLEAQIEGLLTFPDTVLFRETRGRHFDPEFVAWVDRLRSDESNPSR